MSKKKLILIVALASVVGASFLWLSRSNTQPEASTNRAANNVQKNNTQKKIDTFNKTTYSTTDPASIWVIVNKRNQLNPKNYTPTDLRYPKVSQRVPGNESMQLRDQVATAVEAMFAAAKKDGLDLEVSSGYRSYSFQVTLYGGYVNTQGKDAADTQSARPGYSEHQTGLALDIQPASGKCHLEECFADTPEGQWVKNNAYKYGFIMRYTPTKQSVTGYTHEPWHFRFVGVDLATEMHKQNVQTLEEFFNTGAAPDYN